jgi:hypothetical protein
MSARDLVLRPAGSNRTDEPRLDNQRSSPSGLMAEPFAPLCSAKASVMLMDAAITGPQGGRMTFQD